MKRRATGRLHASNATDELGHVSPGAVLEDEEYAALFLDDVVQLYDVVVAAAPQHADLALERLAQLAVELFQLYLLPVALARVVTCRARHTTANEPRPICFSTSHCPMTRGARRSPRGTRRAPGKPLLDVHARDPTTIFAGADAARRLSRAGGDARVDASREGSRAGGGRSRTRRTFGKRRFASTARRDSRCARASCFQPRDPSGDPRRYSKRTPRRPRANDSKASGRRLIYQYARRLQ